MLWGVQIHPIIRPPSSLSVNKGVNCPSVRARSRDGGSRWQQPGLSMGCVGCVPEASRTAGSAAAAPTGEAQIQTPSRRWPQTQDATRSGPSGKWSDTPDPSSCCAYSRNRRRAASGAGVPARGAGSSTARPRTQHSQGDRPAIDDDVRGGVRRGVKFVAKTVARTSGRNASVFINSTLW
jgi:hypothetical protein